MKVFLFCACLILSCISMNAADNYLHILTDDGWKILNIDNIEKISFKEGNMTATGENNQTILSVPSEKIQSMSVQENEMPTGIEVVSTDEAPFKLDSNSASVTMLKDGNFRLINLDGIVLCEIPSVQKGQTIDLSSVSSGILIIQSGSFSLKVSLQ